MLEGGPLPSALGALLFAVLSGHRLATIWHELPEHTRNGPGVVAVPSRLVPHPYRRQHT